MSLDHFLLVHEYDLPVMDKLTTLFLQGDWLNDFQSETFKISLDHFVKFSTNLKVFELKFNAYISITAENKDVNLKNVIEKKLGTY